MAKISYAEIIKGMKSDDVKEAAELAGISYGEMEDRLARIVKQSEQGKKYRIKAAAQLKLAKEAILTLKK